MTTVGAEKSLYGILCTWHSHLRSNSRAFASKAARSLFGLKVAII